MLGLALLFLLVALLLHLFGAHYAGHQAADIAKFVFIVFIVLLVLSVVLSLVAPGPYWYWPVGGRVVP